MAGLPDRMDRGRCRTDGVSALPDVWLSVGEGEAGIAAPARSEAEDFHFRFFRAFAAARSAETRSFHPFFAAGGAYQVPAVDVAALGDLAADQDEAVAAPVRSDARRRAYRPCQRRLHLHSAASPRHAARYDSAFRRIDDASSIRNPIRKHRVPDEPPDQPLSRPGPGRPAG